MGTEWIETVTAIILGTLTASATIGGVLMYRQFGEVRVELRHLANAIEHITAAAIDDRVAVAQSHDAINIRIAAIEKMMTNGVRPHKRRKTT